MLAELLLAGLDMCVLLQASCNAHVLPVWLAGHRCSSY